MKRKPWIIILIAVFHFIEPIFRLGIIYLVHGISPFIYLEELARVKDFTFVVSFLIYPLAGIMILLYRRWAFYFYIFLQLNVLLINTRYILHLINGPFDAFLVVNFLFFIITPALTFYFLLPVVRKSFLDYSLQWWNSKPRYLINIPVNLSRNAKFTHGEIVNISETGIFIKVLGFKENVTFDVSFTYEKEAFTNFKCRSVYLNPSSDGIGAEFLDLTSSQKSQLKYFCIRLRKEGNLRSDGQTSDWDDFKEWCSNLKRGKGIFPNY